MPDYTSSNRSVIEAIATSEAGTQAGTQTDRSIDRSIDVSAPPQQVATSAKSNLDFLAAIILEDIFKYAYPPLFHAMWQMITKAAGNKHGRDLFALGIPRGFSKTILLKLYCVWLVLFSDRRFILVVCNTASHAENFLSDVIDMLNSPNIRNIFGDWNVLIEKDTLALKKFTFRGRNIVLGAVGSGSSLRGMNIKYIRPDIVIMDDMQSRDQAQNPEIAKELLVWMLGTLMKARDPKRCVFIFVGNMYPFEGSILRQIHTDPQWTSLITAAILADGESLWPEHRSVEDLLDELAFDSSTGNAEIFYSEVMNDPTLGHANNIDVSKIPKCPITVDTDAAGGFILIDPSGGKNANSDNTGIGAILIHDGIPILREVIHQKLDPGDTIRTAIHLAAKYGIQLIVVESVAYQVTFIYWFQVICQQLGIAGLHCMPITSGTASKNARIRSGLKYLFPGSVSERPKMYLHQDTRSLVINQISNWNPLKVKNVDELLDIVAYIYKSMEEYESLLPLLISVHERDKMKSYHSEDLELSF
jgi:hypothetical protein